MILRDFLAAFEGRDPDAEVYALAGNFGEVCIYVDGKEAWASDG